MNSFDAFLKSILIKDWYINSPKSEVYVHCPDSIKNWLLDDKNTNSKDKLLKWEKIIIQKASDELDQKLFKGFDSLIHNDIWNISIPDNLEEIIKNKYSYTLFSKN